jgi:hypothetical protein
MGPVHGTAFLLYIWMLVQTISGGSVPKGDALRLVAKLVGHGTRDAQRDRSVPNSIPSEAIADFIDGAVDRRSCHADFAAGAVAFVLKAKREFKLQIPVLFEMRHGDRQEREIGALSVTDRVTEFRLAKRMRTSRFGQAWI